MHCPKKKSTSRVRIEKRGNENMGVVTPNQPPKSTASVLLFADDVVTITHNLVDIQSTFYPAWNRKENRTPVDVLSMECCNDKENGMSNMHEREVALSMKDGKELVRKDKSTHADLPQSCINHRKTDKEIDTKEDELTSSRQLTPLSSIKCGYESETSIFSSASSSGSSLIDTDDEKHVEDFYNSESSLDNISVEFETIKKKFRQRKQLLRDMIQNKESRCKKYMLQQEKLVHERAKKIIDWKRKQRQKRADRRKKQKMELKKSMKKNADIVPKKDDCSDDIPITAMLSSSFSRDNESVSNTHYVIVYNYANHKVSNIFRSRTCSSM